MVNWGPLPTSQMEFFVMIVNSNEKSWILIVPGFLFLSQLSSAFRYCADVLPYGDRKFLTWELLLLFLILKKAHSAGLTNKR